MTPSKRYEPVDAALREACEMLLQHLRIEFPAVSMKISSWANEAFAYSFGAALQRDDRPDPDEDAVVTIGVKRVGGRLTIDSDLAGPTGEVWAEGPGVTMSENDADIEIRPWQRLITSFIENAAPLIREQWKRALSGADPE